MAGIEFLGNESETIIPNQGYGTASQTTQQSAPQEGGLKDMSLASKFSRSKTLSLSPEGVAYIEEFKKLCRDNNVDYLVEPIKGTSIDSILILHENRESGVVIGFTETSNKSYVDLPVPAIMHLQGIIDGIKSRNIVCVNGIVVGPEDYNRAQQLFQYVCDMLDVATGNPNTTIKLQDFGGYDILVSTNPAEADDYIRKTSPHSVMPRMNSAAIFKLLKYGDKPEEAIPVAVVTGYTDFIDASTMVGVSQVMPKFKSMFHMEIFSHLPDPCLMALLLPSMVDIFCLKWGWLSQFDSYEETAMNIGNLIPKEGNTPWSAADRNERDNFIRQYMEPVAVPVLDIMAGRAQLPLVKFLTDNVNDINQLRTRLGTFLNIDPNLVPNPVKASSDAVNEFVGVIKQDQTFDSRYIDYLYMVKKTNAIDRSRLWLNYYPDSRIRAKAMNDTFHHNWEPRYINIVKVINPDFLNKMSAELAGKGVKFIYEGMNQGFGMGAYGSNIADYGAQLSMADIQKTQGGSGNRYQIKF